MIMTSTGWFLTSKLPGCVHNLSSVYQHIHQGMDMTHEDSSILVVKDVLESPNNNIPHYSSRCCTVDRLLLVLYSTQPLRNSIPEPPIGNH